MKYIADEVDGSVVVECLPQTITCYHQESVVVAIIMMMRMTAIT